VADNNRHRKRAIADNAGTVNPTLRASAVARRLIGMADIATKLVHEDDSVRVWELFLEPGEAIERHTHELDYLFYVFEGSTIQVFDAAGEPAAVLEPKAGDVLAFKAVGDHLVPVGGGDPIPATHSAVNVGKQRYREILVETKAR
jgi:beta-alanine degradation protein BauB